MAQRAQAHKGRGLAWVPLGMRSERQQHYPLPAAGLHTHADPTELSPGRPLPQASPWFSIPPKDALPAATSRKVSTEHHCGPKSTGLSRERRRAFLAGEPPSAETQS